MCDHMSKSGDVIERAGLITRSDAVVSAPDSQEGANVSQC